MNADWRFGLAGSLITFSFRIGLAWALCAALASLLRRPDQRFVLWFCYSIGSAIYWITVLIGAITNPLQGNSVAFAPFDPIRIVVSSGWGKNLNMAASLLVSLYFAALIILLVRMFLRHAKLRELVRFGQPPSAEFGEVMKQLCEEMGIKRCELRVLPVITSPATVYWRNPRILWPESCHKPDDVSEFIHMIRHELVHVQRSDYLLSTITNIICAALFFHPLMWSARRRMQVERELASDLAVVEAGPDCRAEYAASLTHLVRMNRQQTPAAGVSFFAPASSFAKRVRSILENSAQRSHTGQLGEMGVAAVAVAAFLVCAPWLSLEFTMTHETTMSRESVQVAEFTSALGAPIRDQNYLPSSEAANSPMRLCLRAPTYCEQRRISALSPRDETVFSKDSE